MADYSKELDFATEAARDAARIAARRFGKSNSADRKPDGTWVTEVDLEVESTLRHAIARAWPAHNILGEEQGLTAAGGGEPVPGAPTWVLDPIDGTHNYMSEIPIWATLVGLRADGLSVVGVCEAPALGETYEAAVGSGARMNGHAISVGRADRLEEATFVFAGGKPFAGGDLKELFTTLADRARRSRGLGDFWGHMLVARGAAHVMLEPHLNVWDVVALQPVVSEAGGRLTHVDGRPWADAGSCLTTNGWLHDQVVELAGRLGSPA